MRNAGQFNVIDPESGWKADLIARKRRPFNESEFARRFPVRLLGHDTFVVSAEDLIIAKLEWARLGGSERQLRDVVGILQVQAEELDSAHIERWVGDLALEDLWAHVQGLLS